MTDWIKDAYALASLIGTMLIAGFGAIAVAGNAGKYAAQYSYSHSAHPSPLASADASGAGSSLPRSPLATYSEGY